MSSTPEWMKGANADFIIADAQAAAKKGDFLRAAKLFAEATDLRPRDPNMWFQRGACEVNCGKSAQARESLGKAIEIRGEEPRYHVQMASAHLAQGDVEAAHASVSRALEIDPDNVQAAIALSDLLQKQGRIDEAHSALEKVIEADGPPPPMAAAALANLAPHIGREAEAVEALRASLRASLRAVESAPAVRSTLLFTLGALLDRMGRYDEAFEAYAGGNRLRATRFDAIANAKLMSQIAEAWPMERVASLPPAETVHETPVFIVGMPRSGTSLTEQILAAHPDVFGAGERREFGLTVRNLIGANLEEGMQSLTKEKFETEAARYAEALQALAPQAKRITDKALTNFMHLGLISKTFPGAPVIHCVRDPMDTCLSCYFQNFRGTIPYAYDLEQLGAYYRQYERLMAHWKTVLDLNMLEVRYEDMVADQEATSRWIVEFLGLPWDDACLRFHESGRVTVTSSNEQVRRPIFSSSVGRAKNYEAHLGPLREALEHWKGP